MKHFLWLILLSAVLCSAQTLVRYDAPFPSISSSTPPYLVANVGANSPVLAWCQSPANAVPCSNYSVTYTGAGVACPNGAQDTPDPNALTSACQPTGDAWGNIGVWSPAGTYDYTVCIGNNCYGPYTVTLGGSGGSSIGYPSGSGIVTVNTGNNWGQTLNSSNLIPSNFLGTGTASLSTCLLGNQTCGACGSITGTGSDGLLPLWTGGSTLGSDPAFGWYENNVVAELIVGDASKRGYAKLFSNNGNAATLLYPAAAVGNAFFSFDPNASGQVWSVDTIATGVTPTDIACWGAKIPEIIDCGTKFGSNSGFATSADPGIVTGEAIVGDGMHGIKPIGTVTAGCATLSAAGALSSTGTACGTGGSGSSSWSALTAPTGALNISMGTWSSVFNYTAQVTPSFYWVNTQAATSLANQNSPILALGASYWNGASVIDQWYQSIVHGAGSNPTSTLLFTQSGSTGQAAVQIPGLIVNGGSTITRSYGTEIGLATSADPGTTTGVMMVADTAGHGMMPANGLASTGGTGPAQISGKSQTGAVTVPSGMDFSVFLNSSHLLTCQLSVALGGGSCAPSGTGGLPSGTGVVRVDSSTGSASEISGDCSTTGSNAITCTATGGVPFGTGATATIANYALLAGATFTGPIIGTTETMSGAISSSGDGIHAGSSQWEGNTTPQVLGINSFAWMGPNSASFTSWAIQPTSTYPTSAGILHIGAGVLDSNGYAGYISQGTVSAVSLTGDVSGILPIANGGTGTSTIANVVLHSNFTNSNTTFTTVTDGTLSWSWAVAASHDYYLNCTLTYEGATATSNSPNFQITGPGSPTVVSYTVEGYNGTAFVSANASSFSSSLDPFGTLASDTAVYTAHIYMGLANGANAGTVAVQSKNTTGTDVLTIYGGSTCRFQ